MQDVLGASGIDVRQRLGGALRVCLIALAGALLSACSGAQSPISTGALNSLAAADPGAGAISPRRIPAKVALIATQTGDPRSAELGRAMRQAAELALFAAEVPVVELMVKDDHGTPDGAREAAEDAVRNGAELILGPLFAGAVTSVAPVAAKAGIPVIAFSSDTRVAGNGVFLLSFLAAQEVPRVVEHAAAHGRRNFAALVPDDAYGQALEQSFKAALARGGASLAFMQRYSPETGGQEAAKILAEAIRGSDRTQQPVDAVFVPAPGAGLAQVAGLVGELGVDRGAVKVLSTGAWAFPGAAVDQALLGTAFAVPDPRGWQAFAERFAKAHRSPPPRLASLAHDAVTVAVALAGGFAGQRFTAAAIQRPEGFTGVDGAFRFLPDGTSERALAVIELGEQGQVVAEPAPASAGSDRSALVAPLPALN